MIDILSLERRWYRYKLKSYIPIVIGSTPLLLIGYLIFSFFMTTNTTKQTKTLLPIQHKQQQEQVKKQKNKQVKTEEKMKQKKEQPTLMHLQPSLSFLSTIKKQHFSTKSQQKEKQKILKRKKALSTPSKKVTIVRENTVQDLKDLQKRFHNTQNPALSLFLAKKYYEMNNFKKAYNYALQTNKLDPKIEQSWIVFTKSLFKLHKKQMAIKTLQEYLKQTNSKTAQQLLKQIENGTFQ